ncbi:hypothetical protein [Sphingomonas prati]|uniref:Uncharacterized protein n=1 Tax=Sphingomonas prati TaxID=1843237 RepID=A0A7W9BQG6_9SPHN|nr:hypothetical protein [Sphingomonas prati]MBB5728286.1 hypothetical protein [Sphingomonas prati]GGE75013.1 hypothetical protein GCM10011404_04420 [Sphingomonas prati]
MSTPNIHGQRRTFSASSAVDAQNAILTDIKIEDGTTWADMGRVLGKSDDRAAAYANTAAAIDLPTFLFGCKEWGGRFADPLLGLVGGRWADANAVCTGDDQAALTLATLLPAIIAIEADNLTEAHELTPHEVLIRRVHTLTACWLNMIAAEKGQAAR